MRLVLFILFLLLAAVGAYWGITFYKEPYTVEISQALIPDFRPADLAFIHDFKNKKSLPVTGAAAPDIDGDHVPELFLGGGFLQRDGLFKFTDGKFVDISLNTGLLKDFADTTYAAVSIDINADGLDDLLIARDSGIFLYTNNKGIFKIQKTNIIPPDDKTAVTVSIALADFNHDGHVDLFLSRYLRPYLIQQHSLFNRSNYGATSRLYINNGDDLSYTDMTTQSGIEYRHNTFNAILADFNNDKLTDIAVAYDAGDIRVYRNNGNMTFTLITNPTNEVYGYPMGIAAADYDNNGWLDIFSTNTGTIIPELFARGDLKKNQVLNRKWILLRNQGHFAFSDIADTARLAAYELGRGAAFADFNLDGKLDIVVASNFVGYPWHYLPKRNARLLIQEGNGTFASAEIKARIKNRLYGSTPLVADFNNDGLFDIVFANVDGPATAFINYSVKRHYSKIILENSPGMIGAVVKLETGSQKQLTQQLTVGNGLASDQEHTVIFGLDYETSIRKIEVIPLLGKALIRENPAVDTRVYIPETLAATAEATQTPASSSRVRPPEPNTAAPTEDAMQWEKPRIIKNAPTEMDLQSLDAPELQTE